MLCPYPALIGANQRHSKISSKWRLRYRKLSFNTEGQGTFCWVEYEAYTWTLDQRLRPNLVVPRQVSSVRLSKKNHDDSPCQIDWQA